MSTTGGHRLKASLRQARAQHGETMIEVGFKDRRIAPLALVHEFGLRGRDGGVKLPERPAFRQAVRDLEATVREYDRFSGGLTHEKAVELAVLMRDALKRAYLQFEGVPLSERQKARKAGTPYADEELVGAEGPKLIEHIGAWVNGERVG